MERPKLQSVLASIAKEPKRDNNRILIVIDLGKVFLLGCLFLLFWFELI